MRLREKEGLLFSEYVWCLLVKTVVERFDQVWFSHIFRFLETSNGRNFVWYSEAKRRICCELVHCIIIYVILRFDFFRETYNYTRIFTKEKFLEAREATFQMMAFLFVDHVKQKQIEFDRFLINSTKVKKCSTS